MAILRQKSQFWVKMAILSQNDKPSQKWQFWVKMSILSKDGNFVSKWQIQVKNDNFD